MGSREVRFALKRRHPHPITVSSHRGAGAAWIPEGPLTTMPDLTALVALALTILIVVMAWTAVFDRRPSRRKAAYSVLVLLLKRRR